MFIAVGQQAAALRGYIGARLHTCTAGKALQLMHVWCLAYILSEDDKLKDLKFHRVWVVAH